MAPAPTPHRGGARQILSPARILEKTRMPDHTSPPTRPARLHGRLQPAALALALATAFGALPSGARAQTLPTGGVAVHGQAVITQPAANQLRVVTQNGAGTSHSSINWQSFSISAGSTAAIVQPSAASLSINRVVTNTPSAIFGNLTSNGRVVLVNQSGIAVGAGAVIDTAGFTASALRMTDADALAGRLRFGEPGASMGGAAGLTVGGRITARDGDIVLVAPNIELGTSALLQAPNGSTILAAGQQVEITGRGLEGITMLVQAPADQARNLGRLEGSAVGIFAGTLRHSGEIQATTASLEGGTVVLKASGDAIVEGAGVVVATGSRGGRVDVLGDRVAIADQSTIDVSGTQGGGSIRVGGDYLGGNTALANARYTHLGVDASLRADATEAGDGGRVIVWADDVTRAHGQISANAAMGGGGGFVETSGKRYLDVGGIRVTASGSPERPGTWLLDPADITITHGAATGPYPSGNKDQFQQNLGGGSLNFFFPVPSASASTLTDGDLNAFLNSGSNISVILQTSNTPEGGGFGDITFDGSSGGAIVIGRTNNVNNNANSLVFNADRNIVFGSGTTTFQRSGAATGLALTVQLNPGITNGSGKVLTSAGANVVLDAVADILNVDVKNGKVWENFGTVTVNGLSVIRLPNESGYATFANQNTGVVNINAGGTWSFLSDNNPQGGIVNNAGTIHVNGVAGGNTTSWEVLYTNLPSGTLHLGAGKLLSMQNADTLGGSLVLDTGSELILSQQFSGSPNVTNAAFSGTGKLSVGSGVSADFSNNSGTLGALDVGGAVSNVAGTLTVGDFVQSGGSFGGSGSLTVTNSFSHAAGTFAPTGALTITQASGNLVFNESAALSALALNAPAGTLSFNGALTVGTTLTLAAGGSINQTGGSLVVGGATVLSAPISAVDLSVGSNDFFSIAGSTGPLTVADINDLAVGAAGITSNNSNVTLSTTGTGNMTLLGNIAAGTGDVTLNSRTVTQSGGAITGAALVVNSSLGSVTLGGANSVTAARLSGFGGSTISFNNQNANYALSGSGGALTVTGPGHVTVDQPLNFASGIDISSAAGITLSANVTPGANLSLASTTGLIEQTGPGALFANSGTATINSGGSDIALDSAGNQFNVVNLAGGHITLVASNGLIVNTLSSGPGQNVFLDAGAGTLLLPATAINAGSGQITLTSGGGLLLGGALTGSDILLSSSTGLTIGNNITASGFLNMGSTAGGVTQSGGTSIVVAGPTTVGAGIAAITLAQPGNNFSTIEASGGAISLRDQNGLNLGSINANTSLDVLANGPVTQSAAVLVSGTTTINAGTGNVTLTTAGNNLNVLSVSGNAINVVEGAGSNLTVTSLSSGVNQPVSLTAGHTLTLPNTGIFTGTADLALASNIGALVIPQALGGNNISLVGAGGITVNGTINALGNISASVSGDFVTTINQDVIAGGTMALTLAGGLELPAANQSARLGAGTGQTINAKYVALTVTGSGTSEIYNVAGPQTITTTGQNANGEGILIRNTGNNNDTADIYNNAGAQTITVNNAAAVRVQGVSGEANIGSAGTQTILIRGASSANALEIGTAGATSFSEVWGNSQSITVGQTGQSGSIVIRGGSVDDAASGIANDSGNQTVKTTGIIEIYGGTAPGVGPECTSGSGPNGGACGFIGTDTGVQSVAGSDIRLFGGSAGSLNLAVIANFAAAGSQLLEISGGGDLVLTGGGGSGSGNRAFVTAAGTTQTVNFLAGGDLTMSGGAVGTAHRAQLLMTNTAGTQSVTGATGITLTAGASGGGSGVGNRALIASSGSQVVSVGAGGITLIAGGGTGAETDNDAQIYQGGTTGTSQSITVTGGGSINLTGGSSALVNVGGSGHGSRALIEGDGDAQTIHFAAGGAINLTGGTNGSRAFAVIEALNGSQSITGAPDITLVAGSSGGFAGEGNRARIVADVGLQTIVASDILLQGGSGGIQNSAMFFGGGGQNLTATGLTLLGGSGGGGLGDGNRAFVGAGNNTSQLINLGSGGLHLTGGGGSLSDNAAHIEQIGTGTQTINITNGALVLAGGSSALQNVGGTGHGSRASIYSEGSTQTITMAGSDRSISLTGGTVGSRNFAQIFAENTGDQVINGASSITLTGGSSGGVVGEGNSAYITANSGSQSISATAITLTGGSGGVENFANIQQGAVGGTQAITLGGGGAITLQGGAGGTTNFARIRAFGTDQTLGYSSGGSLFLTGGTGTSQNFARVEAVNGDQTITGSPTISLTGGASGGASLNGNFASIQASTVGAKQTIDSSTMTLNAGAGGTNNFAFVGASLMDLAVTGNLALNGGGSASSLDGTQGGGARIGSPNNTATDLTLAVTGNLAMTGGSVAGAVIGSGIVGGVATDLDITVGGNVTLNPGSVSTAGSRIGTPSGALGAGNISIVAGGSLTLNTTGGGDTGVLTTGNVFLEGNTVSIADTVRGNLVNMHGASGVSLSGFANIAAQGILDAATVVVDSGAFSNTASANPLATPNGRWLVYSVDPANDTRGSLVHDFKGYGTIPPGVGLPSTGNGLLYSVMPSVTASLVGPVSKTYDGTNVATLSAGNYSAVGIDGDVIVLNNPTTGTYDTKAIGTGKLVTSGNLSIAGTVLDANGKPVFGYNPTVAPATGLVGDISQASITAITGITVSDKVYDATLAATLVTSGAGFTGMAPGDLLTLLGATGTFGTKDVGTGKPVTVNGFSLSGADAGNYTLSATSATTTGNITPATISAVTGITAANKVYDGTTTAALTTTGAAFTGRLGSDVLNVATAVGNFTDKNVANPKTVNITGLSLGGTDAGNYTLASSTATTGAAITPATISAVGGITANKVYDGTTTATAVTTGATLTGAIAGDNLTVGVSSASFGDRSVGAGKALTATGLTLGGTDAGNYSFVATSATGTGAITQRPLSTWSGAGGDGLWSNPLNWDAIPDASNVAAVSIPAGAGTVTFDSSVPATSLQTVSSLRPLAMSSGSLSVGATLAADDFSQSGGTLGGAGSLIVSNSFSQTGGSIAMGNITIVQNSGNLSFTNLSGAAVVLVAPSGSISQSGPLVATTVTTSSHTGTSLTNSSNQFSNLYAENLGTGAIDIVNSVPLNVLGLDNVDGNITVSTTGAMSTFGPVTAATGSVSLAANGSGGNLGIFAPVTAADQVVLVAANTLTQDAAVVGANGVTADAGLAMVFGTQATANYAPVVYRIGGIVTAGGPGGICPRRGIRADAGPGRRASWARGWSCARAIR
jgi:filamentous hemagglutinin family protein